VIPEPPIPPEIKKFPDIIVVSAEDARYWSDACEELEKNNYTKAQLREMFPGLTNNTACNWAIYGWPVQNELTVENHMLRVAQYIKELKAQNKLLRNIIDERQNIMDAQLKKIENIAK